MVSARGGLVDAEGDADVTEEVPVVAGLNHLLWFEEKEKEVVKRNTPVIYAIIVDA